MKAVTDKTQYDLIREDIDLIEKYYGTNQYNELINDILIHVKSAEIQHKKTYDKLNSILKMINDNPEMVDIKIQIAIQKSLNEIEVNNG